jgi:hypothetical protein
MLNPIGVARTVRLLALVAGLAGCTNNHVGRPCDLGVDPLTVASGGAIITSPALECPSRICLLPAATQASTGAGPLCTAGCETNDDCADAESGTSPGDGRCRGGFACGWPTTVGPFCCQKMCICRDLVPEPPGGFVEPDACRTPAGGCPNVR